MLAKITEFILWLKRPAIGAKTAIGKQIKRYVNPTSGKDNPRAIRNKGKYKEKSLYPNIRKKWETVVSLVICSIFGKIAMFLYSTKY